MSNSLISNQAKTNLQSIVESNTNFIPSIKITYAISQHFAEGKAKLGDFFLDDQSLGNSIKATALGYRYQVMALKDGAEFVESLILSESETPFRERKEYTDFIAKHKGIDVVDGIDILLFLPELNLFGVLFCKKKLTKGGLKILETGAGGSVVVISTVKKEWKKFTWYELDVVPNGETVNVPNQDEKLTVYNSQILQITDETVGESERAR